MFCLSGKGSLWADGTEWTAEWMNKLVSFISINVLNNPPLYSIDSKIYIFMHLFLKSRWVLINGMSWLIALFVHFVFSVAEKIVLCNQWHLRFDEVSENKHDKDLDSAVKEISSLGDSLLKSKHAASALYCDVFRNPAEMAYSTGMRQSRDILQEFSWVCLGHGRVWHSCLTT